MTFETEVYIVFFVKMPELPSIDYSYSRL